MPNSPSFISSQLRRIATAIDNSSNPSRALVARDLQRLILHLSSSVSDINVTFDIEHSSPTKYSGHVLATGTLTTDSGTSHPFSMEIEALSFTGAEDPNSNPFITGFKPFSLLDAFTSTLSKIAGQSVRPDRFPADNTIRFITDVHPDGIYCTVLINNVQDESEEQAVLSTIKSNMNQIKSKLSSSSGLKAAQASLEEESEKFNINDWV